MLAHLGFLGIPAVLAASCDVYSPDLLQDTGSLNPADAGGDASSSGGAGAGGNGNSGNTGNLAGSATGDGGSSTNAGNAGQPDDSGTDASMSDGNGGSGGDAPNADAGMAEGGTGGDGAGGANTGGDANGGSVVVGPGKPDTLIDDLEDANTQLFVVQPRNGYWFSYTTAMGDVPEPADIATCLTTLMDCDSGEAGPPGIANNRYAAHLVASNVTGDGAGIGFSFRTNATPYDAAAYTGLAFWAKASTTNSGDVIFALSTAATESECNVCGDHFAVRFTVPTTWTRLELPFSENILGQIAGFGDPATFEPSQLVAFQVQTDNNADFDIWLDEIYFTE